ncbi:MAG: tetratricopeptide repeat protein [Candidatus Acidiferrum sp.]
MELKTTTNNSWTPTQAFALAAISLLLGVCTGWLIRRSFATPAQATAQVVSLPAQAAAPSETTTPNFGSLNAQPSSEELKHAADAQAAPLLEQLKASPSNAALLAQLGNVYYDAKQYPIAIEYYERSLKSQPANTSARTDLGTAYWYTGDAEAAIAQFNKALSYEPNKADTLFNLGVVKWQGKKDAQGAIGAWQKLLDTNPGYSGKQDVQQLIAQAQSH